MNVKKAAEILADKLHDVESTAAGIAPDFDEKSIHAFRVAVKKLRSYLRLAGSAEKLAKIKLSKKIKALYDIAGEIRSSQLEEKKVEKQHLALPGYSKSLKDALTINKNAWQQFYKPKAINKLARKLEGEKMHKIQPKTFVHFLKKHINVLEELADSVPDDENIHTGRKSVKDMLYNIKLAEKYWPKGYDKIAQLPIIQLSQLSDLLGDYNDERLILESHLAFLPITKNAQEKKALNALCTKEKKAKDKQKQLLLRELKTFVTSAVLK